MTSEAVGKFLKYRLLSANLGVPMVSSVNTMSIMPTIL